MTPDREIPESDVSHFDVKIPETKGAGESQHPSALQEEGGKEREVKSFHLRQSHCPLLTKARVQFAASVAKMLSWALSSLLPKGQWESQLQAGQWITSALPHGDMLLHSM